MHIKDFMNEQYKILYKIKQFDINNAKEKNFYIRKF